MDLVNEIQLSIEAPTRVPPKLRFRWLAFRRDVLGILRRPQRRDPPEGVLYMAYVLDADNPVVFEILET